MPKCPKKQKGKRGKASCCSSCGQVFDPDDHFCRMCGDALGLTADPVETETAELTAKLTILQALGGFNRSSRQRILNAAALVLQAELLVPGLLAHLGQRLEETREDPDFDR